MSNKIKKGTKKGSPVDKSKKVLSEEEIRELNRKLENNQFCDSDSDSDYLELGNDSYDNEKIFIELDYDSDVDMDIVCEKNLSENSETPEDYDSDNDEVSKRLVEIYKKNRANEEC